MIVWLYYSAQILFFGAEFTKIYADNRAPAAEQEAVRERGRSGQGKVENRQEDSHWQPALDQPKSHLQQIFLGLAAVIAFKRWRQKS